MKFRIDPGELKHRIVVQRFLNSKNQDNIPVQEWQELFKSRAKVVNVRGEEFIKSQGIDMKISKTFYIRARKKNKITENDRIIYDSKSYNIKYINDIDEQGIYIEIKCEVIN